MARPTVAVDAGLPHAARAEIQFQWFVWFVLFIWLNRTGRTCVARANHHLARIAMYPRQSRQFRWLLDQAVDKVRQRRSRIA
jgi:hypothetical protein